MPSDRRYLEITDQRRKMLRAMRDGNEWHALQLAAHTGLAYATVYQALKAFGKARWATSRHEGQAEHHERKKSVDAGSKGPRRTYWRLTDYGMQQARSL
jgi:DNA-binding PadR family transcriptional regulator